MGLKNARRRHCWTQEKLAESVNVGLDTLKRWEAGKQLPTPDDVGQLEKALNAEREEVWHRWMMETYRSYLERQVEPKASGAIDKLSAIRDELEEIRAEIHSLIDIIEEQQKGGSP